MISDIRQKLGTLLWTVALGIATVMVGAAQAEAFEARDAGMLVSEDSTAASVIEVGGFKHRFGYGRHSKVIRNHNRFRERSRRNQERWHRYKQRRLDRRDYIYNSARHRAYGSHKYKMRHRKTYRHEDRSHRSYDTRSRRGDVFIGTDRFFFRSGGHQPDRWRDRTRGYRWE